MLGWAAHNGTQSAHAVPLGHRQRMQRSFGCMQSVPAQEFWPQHTAMGPM